MQKISRRNFSKKIGMGIGALALNSSNTLQALSNEKQPNFLFICSDQHSYKYANSSYIPDINPPLKI